MTGDALPQKLVMAIVDANDGELLMQALVQAGLPATKIRSAGGFLRRGNSTVLCGVPATQVDEVLAIVRRTCRVRTEMVPVQALPLVGTMAGAGPIEVRTGGAVIFVLDVERFERI